ncbi:MAG: hypothetical protein KIT73_13965 [Burkholderiales bacterium]|nr:hypothetical protein [Burkholderiales bacterium]
MSMAVLGACDHGTPSQAQVAAWRSSFKEAIVEDAIGLEGHFFDGDVSAALFSYRSERDLDSLEKSVITRLPSFQVHRKRNGVLVLRDPVPDRDGSSMEFFDEYRFAIVDGGHVVVLYANIDSPVEAGIHPNLVDRFDQLRGELAKRGD